MRIAAGQAKIAVGEVMRPEEERHDQEDAGHHAEADDQPVEMAEDDVLHVLRRADHRLERLVPLEAGEERP